MTDIVAELDYARRVYAGMDRADLYERARDEILALRSGVYWHGWQCSRTEALAEAAYVVGCVPRDSEGSVDPEDCVAAIRALKDKADAPA